MIKLIIYGAVICLVVLAIWWGPLALLWALNELFHFAIPYTLKTWAAALILSTPFGFRSPRSKD